MSQKIFCYVDETGQDTEGDLFIVVVVVVEHEKEQLFSCCERIEQASGKGQRKWNKTTHDRRIVFIQQILADSTFNRTLGFAVYRNTKEYAAATVQTIAHTIITMGKMDDKATIFIDGLTRTQERVIGSQLRQYGIRTEKVRGVKKDEHNALIRLADAMCGLVRAGWAGQPLMKQLLAQAITTGWLREIKNPHG